jgi:hypothetical protein
VKLHSLRPGTPSRTPARTMKSNSFRLRPVNRTTSARGKAVCSSSLFDESPHLSTGARATAVRLGIHVEISTLGHQTNRARPIENQRRNRQRPTSLYPITVSDVYARVGRESTGRAKSLVSGHFCAFASVLIGPRRRGEVNGALTRRLGLEVVRGDADMKRHAVDYGSPPREP